MINQAYIDEIKKELINIKLQIIKKISPDKIILFGSLAKQNVRSTSDIDLLIINKTDKSFKKRMNELYSIIDYRVQTDMLYYTPEEIERLKNKNMFIKHALAEGIVIYEKD